MCGIAGVVAPGGVAELQAACLRMVQAQAHRGPDDEGLAVMAAPQGNGTRAVLGSRRLAILDLSAAGHQPMSNDDGSVWAVHNGEVYNFLELRETLLAKGFRFHSRTDTEVILRAYEAYGVDCVKHLHGMFAFAIWDQRRQRLFAARDRLGEKPFYYAWDGARFLFASEVRALLASGLVERRLNHAAVLGYLHFGSVPSPATVIEGVRCLGPGCVLTLQHGTLQTHAYWEVSFQEESGWRKPEVLEQLRVRLREAVRSRLISDVPLGLFLSGGLDSSAIAAFAREAMPGRLRTFSLTFDHPAFDEGPYARLVAKRFETEHAEHRVTAGEVWGELDRIIEAMDQPSMDGINTYMIARLTRASGTIVALSGLGGDELFGGYSSFWLAPRLYRLGRTLDAIPSGRRLFAAMAAHGSQDGRMEKLRAFLREAPSSEAAYFAVKAQFPSLALNGLLAESLQSARGSFDPVAHLQGVAQGHAESLHNRVSRFELRTYLHNQLLRDVDCMSMAHALEVRAPLLDHTLVDFLGRVPCSVKFGRVPKQLLIEAIGDRLPREITHRPKGAFAFPFEQWLKHEWRSRVEEQFMQAPLNRDALLTRAGLATLWERFVSGEVRWSRVWAVLVLQLWVRHHIEQVPQPSVAAQHSGRETQKMGLHDPCIATGVDA